jgi:hypothetical protein
MRILFIKKNGNKSMAIKEAKSPFLGIYVLLKINPGIYQIFYHILSFSTSKSLLPRRSSRS